MTKNTSQLHQVLRGIGQIKNALSDLLPTTGSEMTTSQLSNYETLVNANRYTPLTIQYLTISYLYAEHGIIQAAIDMPVQDALRGGFDITSPELSADDIKLLQEDLESNADLQTIAEAGTWARLFGGAGIIINTGDDPETPLELNDLKEVKTLEMYAADRWELVANNRVTDFFQFYKARVHSSRVLTICGKKAPSRIRPMLAGWGMSEVERMVRDLNAYLKNKDVIFDLLDEAKVDVYRIKGLQERLVTDTGTARMRRQIELSNEMKNYLNALVMDVNDDYVQKTQTFSGLPEMVKENRIGMAAAVRMPVAKLFGLSAAGFNSGEDDIENYNAMIESDIRTPLRPVITSVLSLRAIKRFGYKPTLTWKYKPLRIMSESDEENIKTSRLNRLNTLYDRGLVNSQEHAQAMRHYELMPIETRAEQGMLPDQPVTPGAAAIAGMGGQQDDGAHQAKEKNQEPE